MLQQCEARHAVLFYLIKLYEICWATHEFLGKDLLAVISPTLAVNRKTLEQAEVLYQTCGQQLDNDAFLPDHRQQFTMFDLLNRQIKQLELDLARLKQPVWEDNFSTPWVRKKVENLTTCLTSLELLVDKVKACDKKDDMDGHYESFMQGLFIAQHVLLRLKLKSDYSLAKQFEEQIFLLTKWHELLIKFKENITKQYQSIHVVSCAIAVEEKLGGEKYRFNQSFFADVKRYRHLMDAELFSSLIRANEVNLVTFLQTKKIALKQSILSIEESLRTNYDEVRLLAKLALFWRHTNHYGYASSVFHMADEMSQHDLVKHVPIMNERLWPGTTLFFTNVLASISLSLDLYASRYVGVSYTLISSISELLILQIASYEDFFDSIGDHPKAFATEVLPMLREMLNLGIFLLFQGMVSGFSTDSIALAVGAYSAGLLLQKMITALIQRFFNQNNNNAYTIGFITMIANYLSFSMGVQLWYAGANLVQKKWLQPKDDYILFNDRECTANLDDCCTRAEEILAKQGLGREQAAKGNLKSQLRYFLLGHHPDKTTDPDKIATYYQVNAAKQIIKNKCN